MTFVIPAELFPTRYRATSYGIAAASGKIGAIFAQFLFWNVSATYAHRFVGTGSILLL
jgi:PHS family inorganic phosphate transporter-like MFS transporter